MNRTVGRACPQRAESDVFHARRAARRDGLALPGSWAVCMLLKPRMLLRACPKIARGPAARDFGCGQGGEVRASPTRAVRTEPTQATDKRPAARRVFAPKAAWLRCSSVEDPGRIFSFVAPRHPAFGAKTGPRGIFGHALSPNPNPNRSDPSAFWYKSKIRITIKIKNHAESPDFSFAIPGGRFVTQS